MKEPFVITISREVGSGGRTIGRKLAEKLGVRFSDKELIDALQAKLNLSASSIEELKGKKKRWLDDFIQMVAPVPMSGLLVDGDSDYISEYNSSLSVNDVFEAANHFKCFDYILDTVSEPITEDYIKQLHRILSLQRLLNFWTLLKTAIPVFQQYAGS